VGHLNKNELLDWLEEVKNLFIKADIWSDRSEKICQQIRQLIENQPEVTRKFVEKWFEKINYGIPVGSTVPITYLIDFLKEAGVKMKEEK